MKLRRQKFSLDDGLPSKLGSPENAYKRRRRAVVFLNIKVFIQSNNKGLFSSENRC